MKTLILNAGYEPLHFISWQRALCLVLTEKAEIVSVYGEVIRSVSAEFQLPSVVRLLSYVRRIGRLDLIRCTRKNVLMRDRSECQYCGIFCKKSNATVDHVVPRSKGGLLSWENAVTACVKCNLKKGSKTLEQANMKLKRPPRKPKVHELFNNLRQDIKEDWLPYLRHLVYS